MKKHLALALVLVCLFSGCAKTQDVKKEETPKTTTEQTQSSEKTDKKSDTGDKNDKIKEDKPTGNAAPSTRESKPIIGSDGKELSPDEFEDMINKTNDPNTSEEEKQKLLEEIDGILKQLQ